MYLLEILHTGRKYICARILTWYIQLDMSTSYEDSAKKFSNLHLHPNPNYRLITHLLQVKMNAYIHLK